MDQIYIHYLLGFNTLLVVVFTALIGFIAVKRFNVLYLRYLSFVLAIFATTKFIDYLLLTGPSPEVYFGASLFYSFTLCALPITMLLMILALTGGLDNRPMKRRSIELISFIISLLFSLAVALVWEWPWVVDLLMAGLEAIILSILVGSAVLLIRALVKGTQERNRILVLLAFVMTNLISVPVLDVIMSVHGPSVLYLVIESVSLTGNVMIMAFLILYVDPQETMMSRYETLKSEFQELMKYAGDGIAILDLDGKVVSSNIALNNMVDRSKGTVIGRSIESMVPPSMAPVLRSSLKVVRKGGVARETRHSYIKGSGPDEKRETSTHVLSTFSPIKDKAGKLVGILLVSRDHTPVMQLDVERALRARSEAQNQLQRLMTSLIPVLLASSGGGHEGKGMYLSILLNNVEKALRWSGRPDRDDPPGKAADDAPDKVLTRTAAPTIQDHLCNIMNNLGGSFYWEDKEIKNGSKKGPDAPDANRGSAVVFYGADCPWGAEAKKNPILCNLCKGIFTRLVIKEHSKAVIDLVSTIANGDGKCTIVAGGLDNEAGSKALTRSNEKGAPDGSNDSKKGNGMGLKAAGQKMTAAKEART